MKKYVYDEEHNRFIKDKRSFTECLYYIAKYFFLVLITALLCYVFFALFFDTDKERRLSMENDELQSQYDEIRSKAEMVEGVISDLEVRDRNIYNDVFKSDPPQFADSQRDSSELEISGLFNADESDVIWDTFAYSNKIELSVTRVSRWLSSICSDLEDCGEEVTSIPSIIPMKNFKVIQTGASIGQKVNPFLKMVREHNGIDLMAPLGTDVICSADGVVVSVDKTSSGLGSRVEIQHYDDITTTYSHLGDILVRKGQMVKQGMVIGRVGSTGTSFAPCLHYEVIRNGKYQEPVNYFFADLSPDSFREMILIAKTTGQSMD